jgi:hypothetical protein
MNRTALGFAPPDFLGTARATYVHLLPEDLPAPDFLDAVTAQAGGNTGGTQPTETSREAGADADPDLALQQAFPS